MRMRSATPALVLANHENAIVLLRHNVLYFARFLGSGAAWKSRQVLDESENEPSALSRNRVWNVPLEPQWWGLWVCNLREWQALGTSRWNEALRGTRLIRKP